MTEPAAAIVLPEASPRDRVVQHVVLKLVEVYAFREAAAVLSARLREIGEGRRRHLEQLFLDWRELPEDGRPDFLTYAHRRRDPALEAAAEADEGGG